MQTKELEDINNSYAFDEARMIYRKFKKFEIGEVDEMSILHTSS